MRSTGRHPSRAVAAALGITISLTVGWVGPAVRADDGVDQAQQKVRQVAAQLNAMEDKLVAIEDEHNATLDRIDELNAQIAAQQADIEAQEGVLAQLQGQLATIAVDSFASGGAGGLTPLLSDAQAFVDQLQRGELARVALDQGAGTTEDLNQLLTSLAQQQRSLQTKQAQAQHLADVLTQKQQEGEALQAQLLEQQQQAQQAYGDAVAAERQRQADEAAAAQAAAYAAAQQRAAAASATTPAKHSSTKPRGGGGSNNGGSSSNDGGGSTSSGSNNGGSGSNNGGSGSSGNDPTPTPTPKSGGGGSDNSGSGGGNDTGNIPPVSSRASVAISAAAGQLGVPYKFAQSSPGVAFDCSGLTAYAWGRAGVSLPHQSAQQYASTPHVPVSAMQPGDLIFYGSPIHHVGIYVGGGTMIHAPQTGGVVEYTAVKLGSVVGVSRPG